MVKRCLHCAFLGGARRTFSCSRHKSTHTNDMHRCCSINKKSGYTITF